MTVRTFEARTYTLASEEARTAYATVYYPNHEVSLPKLFGVTVHGYWSAIDAGTDAFRFTVLLSYPEGADPEQLRGQYRAHPEAAANMPGFDPSVIRGISSTFLVPAATSPLT